MTSFQYSPLSSSVVVSGWSGAGLLRRGPEEPGPGLVPVVRPRHPPALQELRHRGDGAQHLLALQVRTNTVCVLFHTVCRQLLDLIVFSSLTWNWYRVRNWIMIFGLGHWARSLSRPRTHFLYFGVRNQDWHLPNGPHSQQTEDTIIERISVHMEIHLLSPISCINWIENCADGLDYLFLLSFNFPLIQCTA